MSPTRIGPAIITVAFVSAVGAQSSGWVQNQVNASMCKWEQLRAAVLRDTLYLDGGNLWWYPGMADGTYGSPTQDGNPLGIVYTLNFSRSFNMTQNISAILGSESKAPGSAAANNIAPKYFDGAMLANDNEWFFYGGLLDYTVSRDPPDGDEVMAYRKYQYGVEKPSFSAGFLFDKLPDSISRYLAYGGAANAPSENTAWYFSGLRSSSWGPIYAPGFNSSLTATNVSNTLITLNMTTQQQEEWRNDTLPTFIQGRANPELVWVPIGAQGILVALGGVLYPEFDNVNHRSINETGSETVDPTFMSTIDVYDVASGKWYQQSADGSPPAYARGCAVMTPAKDYSSFNIYWYGGYDGLNVQDSNAFTDDVWVLSLPSFTWTKLASGRDGYARAGHQCVQPYPDQMMVVGGYTSKGGQGLACLKGLEIIQLFNLTSGEWLDSYDPKAYGDYGVPEMIYKKIGGAATGGATVTTPSPSGWVSTALASVFATPYPTSKLTTTYYPYAAATPTNSSRPDVPTSDSGGGGQSLPSWVPPVLGVVLGLILITAVVVGILLWRRRKLLRKNGGVSEPGTDENGNRVLSWIRGQPPLEHKAPTITTSEDMASRPDMEEPTPYFQPLIRHEMADDHIAELMDTSPRNELQDTGLSPAEVINKHSHFAQNGSGSASPLASYYSSIAATDHASMVSSNSGAQAPKQAQLRKDSPAVPEGGGAPAATAAAPAVPSGQAAAAATTRPPANRGESGVSDLSERDRTHLRQISDPATVSTMGGSTTAAGPGGRASTISSPPVVEEDGLSPGSGGVSSDPSTPAVVSPPTAGEMEGDDYISARRVPGAVSPRSSPSNPLLRKSVFHESREDMGSG